MGPLKGYTVVELAGIGPAPMAGMILADMGATVIRVERSVVQDPLQSKDVSLRGKKSIALNLKHKSGLDAFLALVEKADVLIEGYRPGVTEKMGIGPEDCWRRNPKLVYGRMTGWGQEGPLSQAAGHDINYISLTGALYACGHKGEKPTVPLNLVGDMGGGGMLLVSGILAALLESKSSNKGQVVDAAMLDGAAQLMWMFHGFHAQKMWNANERGSNLLDGGAYFYDCYETADGKYLSVGPIEPQFYKELLKLCDFDEGFLSQQMNPMLWQERKKAFTKVFLTKTQHEWCELLEGTDACVAPVLSFEDAPNHPHNRARNTYIDVDGFTQPAPAPRFSRTPSKVQHGQHKPGADGESVFRDLGFPEEKVNSLIESGVLLVKPI